MLKDNVLRVIADIEAVAKKAGRSPDEITLIGVTKFVPIEAVVEAVKAGIVHIAENRVQEAQKKFPSLIAQFPHLKTYLIGHLQSNKAKDAIGCCHCLQSVDSLKLAMEIEKQASKNNQTVDILIQFNTAHEEQKFGANPEEAMKLLESIGSLEHLRVKGLMAMAPLTYDNGVIRKAFADLRGIRDMAKKNFDGHERLSFNELSMGMSSDMQIAIEEGSTMVRVGSAIFKEVQVAAS